MRRVVVLAWIGMWVVLAGCSSNKPAAASGSGGQSVGAATGSAAAGGDDSPAPPAGAQYTLLCNTFTGATHISDAKNAKDILIQTTGSKDWYVVHSSDESDLYYGFYTTIDDRSQTAEYRRVESDRARLASLVNQDGMPLFSEVLPVPINLPDPPAPKEWDLSQNTGYWTLQIAVYRDNPQRKQAAVDAVKAFRAHGVEAYFRHGPSTSEVYIGSWPRSAVAEQDASVAQSDDPSASVKVMSSLLPEDKAAVDGQGRPMKVVQPKVDILDPSLKQAVAQYPYYYVNGEIAGHKVRATGKEVPWPSYLIQVPHDESEDVEAKPGSEQNSDLAQPSEPSVPGLGGLR